MINSRNILFYIAQVIDGDKSNYCNKLHELMALLYINRGGSGKCQGIHGNRLEFLETVTTTNWLLWQSCIHHLGTDIMLFYASFKEKNSYRTTWVDLLSH